MNKLLSIKEASKLLVSESTLRRWEREKKLIPDEGIKEDIDSLLLYQP